MKPKVSVCIQTYKQAKYIRECLDSVFMQKTDFDFEVLIGEDDSKDGTREICIEYAQKYPGQVRLFLNDRKNVIYINGQPTGRWNLINNLKQAQGEYIALCEGDDYWTTQDKLFKQVSFLEKNKEFSGAFHQTQVIYEDDTLGKIYGKFETDEISVIDTIATSSPFHTSSFIFRKEHLTIPAWFNSVVSADMALFAIIASKGKLKGFPEIMSHYRKHAGGITQSQVVKETFHHKRIELMQHLDQFLEGGYHNKIAQVIDFHKKQLNNQDRVYKPSENFLKKTIFLMRSLFHH